MNNSRLARIVLRVNVARSISDHLLGQEHPIKHRMKVGAVLMTSGVLIAQLMAGSYFHFLFEGVGYMIHGTGLIPFIDWFSQEKGNRLPESKFRHEVQGGMGVEDEDKIREREVSNVS